MTRPLRVVAAAVVQGDRVLAARRAPGAARGGLWELPGGKVEPGEDDPAALRRELREELGIEVEVGPRLGEVTHAYPELTIHLVAYAVRQVGGTLHPAEHTELRWLPVEALAEVSWAPADVPLLAPLSRHLRGSA